MKNTAQLPLFEQYQPAKPAWSVNDIWTPAWNLAIDLAIIMACTGKWVQLKEMAALAIEFGVGNENYPPFSYQVCYLEKIGKLKLRKNSINNPCEWMAA
jgi:hypothetical protein